MKVAWVLRPAAGGILQHLKQLLAGLSDKYQIVLFGPQELSSWAEGYPFIPIDIGDGIDLTRDMVSVWRLAKMLCQVKPNFIHVHGLKAAAIAVPAAKLSRVQNIIYTAHNCLPKPVTLSKKFIHWIFQGRILRSLTKVIAVSDAVKDEFRRYLPENRIITIYNGIDYRKFAAYSREKSRSILGFKAEDLIIGVVARLIPEKGIAIVLQAASLLKPIKPGIKFVIVGDGPARAKFENYSKALALKNTVYFTGYRSDVAQLMAGWDLFMLPSLSEGFSISVLEAMAAKLPLIVSDLPSMREMVVHGKSGYLVNPEDAVGLSAAVIRIIKENPKAKAMGEFNYRRVAALFNVENMVKNVASEYDELVKKG